jgi:predicted RNase H-like HicB family nuclease
MTLKVILQPGDEGGYIAEVPAFKGCRSQGRTRDEALRNVREALEGWLEATQDKDQSGPSTAGIDLIIGSVHAGSARPSRSVAEILRQSPGGRMFKTSREVDDYLREERAAWDR